MNALTYWPNEALRGKPALSSGGSSPLCPATKKKKTESYGQGGAGDQIQGSARPASQIEEEDLVPDDEAGDDLWVFDVCFDDADDGDRFAVGQRERRRTLKMIRMQSFVCVLLDGAEHLTGLPYNNCEEKLRGLNPDASLARFPQ